MVSHETWQFVNSLKCRLPGWTNFYSTIYIQGVPRNMTVARRLESRLWSWNLFLTFSRQPTSTCMILKTTTTKFSSSWDFQNVVCLFCTVNITGDIKNFVQIAILLNKTKMVDIWMKIFISRVTFKAQKIHYLLSLSLEF